MTSDSEQWGPWIEHSGDGCPGDLSAGIFVMVEHRDGTVQSGLLQSHHIEKPQWRWRAPYGHFPMDIVAYRIRRPAGLTILERLADQPEPVDA